MSKDNQYEFNVVTEKGVLDSYDSNDKNSIIYHSSLIYENSNLEINDSNSSFVIKTKCFLEFTGEAEDRKDNYGKERQYCHGDLSVLGYESKTLLKGEDDLDLKFEAISGFGYNGLLPNGEYFVTADEEIPKRPPYTGEFPDENGFSFKMRLKPRPPFPSNKKYKVRDGLLIHPVFSMYRQDPAPPNYAKIYGNIYYGTPNVSTNGCIALCESWIINQKFYNLIQLYLKKNREMLLIVNVNGNYNLKHQIGNAATYKNTYE